MGATNVFTYSLDSDTLSIEAVDNVQRVSVICSSGFISIQGSVSFKGLSPSPINLTLGQGITISTKNDSLPIDGLIIDATSGAADIIISFQ